MELPKEYKITEEQVKAGIDPNYIVMAFKNEFNEVPRMSMGQRSGEMEVRIWSDVDYTEFLASLTEREDKATGSVAIETIDLQDRLIKIKAWAKDKGIEVKYFPKSEGCIVKDNYVNYQRYFFSRSLTNEEKEEVIELLKSEWQISG